MPAQLAQHEIRSNKCMVLGAMFEQTTTDPTGDQGRDEDIGIEDDSHETRLKTSWSEKTPCASAFGTSRSRKSRNRRKNRCSFTARAMISSGEIPSLRVTSSSAARTSGGKVTLIGCATSALSFLARSG